jgi:DnaJ-class molecular chaperone
MASAPMTDQRLAEIEERATGMWCANCDGNGCQLDGYGEIHTCDHCGGNGRSGPTCGRARLFPRQAEDLIAEVKRLREFERTTKGG